MLLRPASVAAQGCAGAPNCTVASEAQLQAAINTAVSGNTIIFTNSITLTANLPGVGVSASGVVIDGGGFTLSGNNLYRGLAVGSLDGLGSPVSVTIQNLTIANTVASGGAGGSGVTGGGGGAGLGGALFIDAGAAVSVSNVFLNSNAAKGGAGGSGSGLAGVGGFGGGGGGMAGAGTNAVPATNGGNGGGLFSGPGGGGAGQTGLPAVSGVFGAGGGGASADNLGTGTAGSSLFGGGGGGGDNGAAGGFGAGGGGTGPAYFAAAAGGLFGGAVAPGSLTGYGGGGGAGLGGAVFVSPLGSLVVSGAFSINGASASGGAAGGAGAGAGSAFGSGIFMSGGPLTFAPGAGQTATITGSIADQFGSLGSGPTTAVGMFGLGTLVLGGNNNFAGGVLAASGTVSVSADANLGLAGVPVEIGGGATLKITGTGLFSRPIFMDPGAPIISVAPGQTATWSGALLQPLSASTLTVTGGGTLSLTQCRQHIHGRHRRHGQQRTDRHRRSGTRHDR